MDAVTLLEETRAGLVENIHFGMTWGVNDQYLRESGPCCFTRTRKQCVGCSYPFIQRYQSTSPAIDVGRTDPRHHHTWWICTEYHSGIRIRPFLHPGKHMEADRRSGK